MVGVNVHSATTTTGYNSNSTNKSKRGGRRINRHESFEDLFTGNSFGGQHATSSRRAAATAEASDEGSLNAVNFEAPFSHAKGGDTNNNTTKKSHFVGESDDEMSGDEEMFVSSARRGGRRRGSQKAQQSCRDESDAGSVDFNNGDFDQFQSDDEGNPADLEASFSWKKPGSVVQQDGQQLPKDCSDSMQELTNAFNASFSKRSPRKEKKHIPLSAVIISSGPTGTPVSSVASSSVTGTRAIGGIEKTSSSRSPTTVAENEIFDSLPAANAASPQTNVTDESFFDERAKASEAPEGIATNTPLGLAGTYVMSPSRSRSRSRSRAPSRTPSRTRSISRARSRSRTREREPTAAAAQEDTAEFPSMFANDVAAAETSGDLDLFANNPSTTATTTTTTQPASPTATTNASAAPEPSSKSSSRDSGKSSRGRSKSRSRTSSKEVKEVTDEQKASPTRSSRSTGKVTRIRIKSKGNRKIDPATAKRLIAEKMKQLKDSGDHSESSQLLESMNELFIMEKNNDSANLSSTSLTLNDSTGDCDIEKFIDKVKKKEKKHKKKSKEGDEKKKKSKKKSKDASELEESFTESSLSKHDSFNASARFNESFSMSLNFADSFQASKLPNVEESLLETDSEQESRSRSKSKSRSSRARSASPTKRSKSGDSSKENEKKERSSRSKSPTKRSKKEGEEVNRERLRSKSPSKRTRDDNARPKTPAATGERSRSKTTTEKSKEHRARSKSRVRSEETRSKSRAKTRT